MNKLYVGIGIGAGIGLSTAEKFAHAGYDLVIAARNEVSLQQFAGRLSRDTGRKVECVSLDVLNLSSVEQLATRYGAETAVVHYNAAAMHDVSLFDAPVESLEKDLTVDITGALVTIKAFTPFMERNGHGTILLTGGGFALYPSAEYLTLSIGKAGIRSMTEALFPVLAEKGIHLATVTVMKVVAAGTKDAEEAANAFWHLHNQRKESWTWEYRFA
jgi:short-subunit dehydrogenase